MKVELRAPMNGFLIALVTLMTLGLYPLLRRAGERHFIIGMDDAGIRTRGGRKIAWGEIIGTERVVAKVNGIQMSDEYVIRSARAKASLPLWRAANAREARDFFLDRVPQGARRGGRRT
jgi:hypothetical protein